MSPKRPESATSTFVQAAATVAQIWRADLDDTGWDRFQHVLSQEEEDKAKRYRTARLAAHYRRCRSILRLLLADNAGQDPAQIVLRYGWAGKPEAVGMSCHFNVSHTDGRSLIALSPHPVGIDIENTAREHIRMEELVHLVCHSDEQAALAVLSPALRQSFLYRLWVQKEAYCKALGSGLQSDLRSLHFEPTTAAGVARVRDAAHPDAGVYYVRTWHERDASVASLCLPLCDGAIVTRQLAPHDCAEAMLA